MNNVRLLTLIAAICYVAIGISSPLITLYLQSLGADYAQISLILASVVVTMLVANYAWGRLSDRIGRRKPLLIAGLAILACAYFFLSRAADQNWAWAARIFEGTGTAAYTTLSLAMMGDLLDQEQQKGRRMGVYRGLASLAFAGGALVGGRLADRYSIAQALLVCSVLYIMAALCGLALREVKRSPIPAAMPETPAVKPTERSRLPALFLAGVALWVCAHSASTSMWPNYMAQFGYSKTAISSLWGLAAFIEMPAMRTAGIVSDTLGRAPLLTAGGIGITLVQFGYIFLAQSLPLLLGVQVVRGFAFGSYTTTAMTFATENAGQSTRGSKSGIFNTAASSGQLLGMFLGGRLAQSWGFEAMFGVCAALALSSAVCFWMLRYFALRPSRTPVVQS